MTSSNNLFHDLKMFCTGLDSGSSSALRMLFFFLVCVCVFLVACHMILLSIIVCQTMRGGVQATRDKHEDIQRHKKENNYFQV